jgi:hypothetical protein
LDGTTDNTDLAELKKQAHEKSYTFESKSLVDFNLDGKLDQIDVRMLASALEKSGTRLSCPARPPVCGDITNNGDVSSLDASRLAQITKGLMENTLEFYAMGDLDLDGEITDRDAKILQEYVVGLRKELFCPARSPQ